MQQATLGDRYRLLDTLGGGGMAKVYLAHDEILGRDVAVKVLREQFTDDDEFVERFRREARSAASLRHPNIVQVYDQGEAEDGSHFMAMEHVSGGTLKDKIIARGRLSPEEASSVALNVAEALGAAHEKGVVHRDIKPQNVLLTETGEPKVADFGIARAASAATISQTSRVLGTAGYMSPEQALGERVSPGSDLYSLGVVLYEMLVGELPYDADTAVAIAIKHINEPPSPPGEVNENVPASLDAITMKLLAKRPENRYATATALAGDLRRVLDGLPPAAAGHVYAPSANRPDDAPTTISPAPKSRSRGSLMRVAVAVVAGLLLFGGVVYAAAEAPWEEAAETAGAQSEAPAETESPEPPPEVPDVVGLSENEARGALEGEGFEVRVGEAESSEADEGNVLRQSVAAGSEAEEGSTVGITVGEGPSLVETPSLMSESEAPSQLEEANLELGDVSYSPSDAAAGAVISQNPAPGTEVEEGTAVDITVGTEPEEAEPAPVESAPVESAPVESAPVESAPVESAPVESAPVESAPVESAPVESAPVESAPVESAPVESAPVESAPVESAPAEPAPQPVESAPVESGGSGGQSLADEMKEDIYDDIGIER